MKTKEKLVEELSEALFFTDPSNPQVLLGLHSRFEEIGQWAIDASQSEMARAAEAAAKFIEKIIFEEASNAKASIEVIGRLEIVKVFLSTLQSGMFDV